MKKMFLSALAVAALAFVGCTEDATNDLAQNNGGAAVELHTFTFEAEIEQPSRTSLVDPGTGTSYVCWDKDDVVAIITDNGVYAAIIASGEGTPYATYTAEISGNPLAAVYPYSFANSEDPSITYDSDAVAGRIGLLFPNYQIHKTGSVFGDDVNAMVGVAQEGENGIKFAMKSVMGALELKFKGSQKVQGITVKASNADVKLSGVGYVTANTNGNHTLTMADNMTSQTYVTLEVPETVTLNTGEATSFYVLVPAGTYEGLQIGVMTEDGSYVRTATKAHTVKASEILPINCGDLDAMIDEASAVNLSASQWANCYAVVPGGAVKTYVFDTKCVDGSTPTNSFLNGNNESVEGHEEFLQPHMAQILWAEELGVAYDIQFDRANGKIYFKNDGSTLGNVRIMLTCDPIAVAKSRVLNTGKSNDANTSIDDRYVLDFEGNSIYIKRAEQCFIWGWHIWSTPTALDYSEFRIPAGSTDSNGDGYLSAAEIRKKGRLGWMDRNLGATWLAKTKSALDAATNDNLEDALGLYYEFGNMTPYPRPAQMKGHSTADFGFSRTKYMYGFNQYSMKWTSSGSFKTTVEEVLQFPYYFFKASYTPANGTQKPTDAAELTKYKKHFGTDSRNSWIDMEFKGGGLETDTPPAFWGKFDGSSSTVIKGLYDPCPPGYCMPHQGNVYQTCTGQKVNFLPEGATTPINQNAGAFSEVCTKKINEIPVGTYITFDGTNIDYWPNSGYSADGKITFNKTGNLAYVWAVPYHHQIENYSYKSGDVTYGPYTSYNCGARGTFNQSGTGSYQQFWPQVATGYNVRCMKYVPSAKAAAASAASYNIDEATGL